MQQLTKVSPILAMLTLFLRFLLVDTVRIHQNTLWIDPAINIPVVDAVVVTTDSELWELDSNSSLVKRIRFVRSSFEQAGFLVTVSNRLPTQRDGCTAWGTAFELRSTKQTVPVGCSRYMVAYFEPPLELTMIPSALRPLTARNDSLVVTVSAVTFSCADDDETYRSCPSIADFCVARRLFCDGADNCGLRSDERDCESFDEDGRASSAKAAIVSPITRHRLRSDELIPIAERNITMTVVVVIGCLVGVALGGGVTVYFLRRRASRRHVLQHLFNKYFEQYDSIKERAVRKKSHEQLKRSKRIIKGVSSYDSGDSEESNDEAMNLLSWGIRQHLKRTLLAPSDCQRHSVI